MSLKMSRRSIVNHVLFSNYNIGSSKNTFIFNCRYISGNKSKTKDFVSDPELLQFMHGRKNSERRDSVTTQILEEREKHNERLQEVPVLNSLVRYLKDEGLGTKKKRTMVFSTLPLYLQQSSQKSLTGAGGYCIHVASASQNWPVLKHLLPEICFAGHSNSGKSTLVNAISGLAPRKGPASISDRAGWTDQICFYQLGKRPPLFTLVDMPGYGHAVASALDKKKWTEMNRNYLYSRKILSRCCILVDCTRGLCREDKSLAKYCTKLGIEWQIILTKCDLLDATSLAQSICIVNEDLSGMFPHLRDEDESETAKGSYTGAMLNQRHPDFKLIIPVSASTGAGIRNLWTDLLNVTRRDSLPPNGTAPGSEFAVREHINAKELRAIQNKSV